MKDNLIDIDSISPEEFLRLKLERIKQRKKEIEREESTLLGLFNLKPDSKPAAETQNSGDGALIEQVRAIIKKHGGYTAKEIAEKVTWGESDEKKLLSVRWTLSGMAEKKEIRGEGERNKRWYMK